VGIVYNQLAPVSSTELITEWLQTSTANLQMLTVVLTVCFRLRVRVGICKYAVFHKLSVVNFLAILCHSLVSLIPVQCIYFIWCCYCMLLQFSDDVVLLTKASYNTMYTVQHVSVPTCYL